MRFAWLSLIALAACVADDSSEYPTRPGAGGGTVIQPGDRPDAEPGPDAMPATMGRVCVTIDPRDWDAGGAQCISGLIAADLTVAIGADTTTTIAGGFFTFPTPPSGPTIKVTGAVITSIRKFTDPDDLDTVAIISANWESWKTGTGFDVTDGNAALVIELRDNGVKRPGFTATSNPPPGTLANSTVYYDDNSGFFTWNDVMTEDQSKALFADVAVAGAVTVEATIASRMASDTFPVEGDAITFGVLNVPP
jgi:hypothetical protein